MSGMWQRTLVYLGLKEEPEEGYDELPERLPTGGEPGDSAGAAASIREFDDSVVRPLRAGDVHVRPVGSSSTVRVAVVEVREFDDVEAIGARYRTGQAVLFDVSGAGPAIGRRVVDFVSGLTYVSRGTLTKVGTRAFLLVPEGSRLENDELRRLTGLGYRVPAGSGA